MARVLILDDSPLQSACLRQLLEQHGYQVACAATLMQARRLQRSLQPQLQLVELVLWQGNGFSQAVALARPDAVTALMTARHLQSDHHWAAVRGIDRVLVRPQPESRMLADIDAMIGAL